MKNKFVLISQQGGGSNLLKAFLNSHPDIHVHNEFFCKRRDERGWVTWNGKEDECEFLDRMMNINYKVVGIDLKYNHFNEKRIKYINENNFKVIHLLRDPARTFFQPITEDKQTFTLEQVKQHCKIIREYREKTKEVFKDLDILELTYEEMTKGHKIEELDISFANMIFNFLGVEYKDLWIEDEDVTKNKLVVRF